MSKSTIQLYDFKGRRKYLTQSERERFEEAANTLAEERRLFCLTVLYTGCRISEALALTKERVDIEESFIVFITLKQNNRKEDTLYQRAVPIPRWLTENLTAIFTADKNKIWSFSRTTGWRIIKQAMSLANICGIHGTARGLRHSFGISCVHASVPITVVATAMGHSSLKSTSVYLNAVGEEQRELFARTWKTRKDE